MRVPPPLTWQQWKINHQYELQHIAGYEEAFVDNILSQLYGVSPNDVIPQYHFIDVRGNNRYIDFMIINENKGWLLPIELDGFAKLHDYGSSYDHFQDMLYRQNEIIMKFGSILRFTNKDMYQDKKRTLAQISKKLKEQATLYEQKSLVKVETKVIEKIVEKPVTIIRHIEVEKPIEVYVDRPVEVIKYIEPPKPQPKPLPKPKPIIKLNQLEYPESQLHFWWQWYKFYELDKKEYIVEKVFKKIPNIKPKQLFLDSYISYPEEVLAFDYTYSNLVDIFIIFTSIEDINTRLEFDRDSFSAYLHFTEGEVLNYPERVANEIYTTAFNLHNQILRERSWFYKVLGWFKSLFTLAKEFTAKAEELSTITLKHSEQWVEEAKKEKAKELSISEEEVQKKLEQLRNRKRN